MSTMLKVVGQFAQEAERSAAAANLERGTRHTDVGNGERFALQHGSAAKFVHDAGVWRLWDGRRWAVDTSERVMTLAKETVRHMYATAADLPTAAERKALAHHALQSEREARLQAMLNLARTEPEITATAEQFDVDPWLLNVLNGTLDLRTGELRPHRREDLITCLAPVDFDPAARCPRFEGFLLEVLDEKTDPRRALDIALYLQRAIGYSLTGLGVEHSLIFCFGKGRNGKGTLFRVIAELLGDYARTTDVSTLLESRDVKSGPRPELLALRGARFVSAVEPSKGRRFNEGLLKQLTGGDSIAGRALHSNKLVEFRPTFLMWLAANNKPEVRGTDVGIWSRIALVPFTVEIPPERRDLKLQEKLHEELPGILRWAVEGCRMWQSMGGLRPPAGVAEATSAYRAEMDALGGFLSECCEPDGTALVPARALYEAYKAWAERNGEVALSNAKFGRDLNERGIDSVPDPTRRGCLARRGLRLRVELGAAA